MVAEMRAFTLDVEIFPTFLQIADSLPGVWLFVLGALQISCTLRVW